MRILITGANRGIGRALAAQYRASGHQVCGTARQDAAAQGLLALDVTVPQDFAALAAGLPFDGLDLLVCNAGIYPDKGQDLAQGYDAALWAAAFASNVTGVFLTVQTLLPHLRRGQAPRIAIIGSQMGSQARAPGGSYIYRASKAAVLNLGRNLATDLRASGISLGVYHPGWVRTDMGGAGAEIDVASSAAGLIARFDQLNLANSGCFEGWDGAPIPY